MWLLVLYSCLCLAAIFIPYAISGPSDGGASVPWRPAPINYSIVWTILCVLLSISLYTATTVVDTNNVRGWNKTPETTIRLLLYCAILCCLGAWAPVYHQHKANGVTVFLWVLLFLAPLFVLLGRATDGTIPMATLAPLVVWTIFQLMVNIKQIEQT